MKERTELQHKWPRAKAASMIWKKVREEESLLPQKLDALRMNPRHDEEAEVGEEAKEAKEVRLSCV